jgi:cytochrome c oxidase subunit III
MTTHGAPRAARRPQAMPTGMWGMALFIATEATLFGTLFATYFYLRFNTTRWPPPGVPGPKVALPLILTAVLVASTVPVFFASRAADAGNARLAWLLFLGAFVVQGAYLGVQIHEFVGDLGKFGPHDSAYASIYFALLGAHHLHVALGLALEVWLLGALLRGLTRYRLVGVRAISMYWYFVSLLGVAVVLTQVYPAL